MLNESKLGEMMQDEFKNYLSMLQHANGVLRSMGTDRYMLASTTWLTDLQQEIENIIGPDGAYAVFESASRSGGQSASSGASFAALFAGMPLEERVKLVLKYGQFQGWGRCLREYEGSRTLLPA